MIGVYKLTITTVSLSSEQYAKIVDPQPDLYITLWNDAPIAQYSRSLDYTTVLNGQAGLLTQMYDTSLNADYRTKVPTPLLDIITTAEVDLYDPDGDQSLIPMHDDGLHGDGAADDGVYGATIPSTELGEYHAQAILSGTDNEGNAFIRSTEHIIRVVPNNLQLTGTAQGIVQSGQDQMQILIDVTYTPAATDALIAYAEVWAVDQSNNEVAVCWISGAVDAENNALPLELNLQWLAQANAKPPITLKNVYVQNNLIPVATAASIPVTASGASKEIKIIRETRLAKVITAEMKQGRRPASLVKRVNASTVDKILLHGYCSTTNPWPIGDFTNAIQFLNPSASITNDEFANLVAQFAVANNIDAFGLIGHSQGGMASVHLHNFYWSGLEVPTTGRKIQSLGTPYQGNSAAGTLADIGEFFGIGCGSNFDLSRDGAQLWVPTITSDSQLDLWFYTTQYETGYLINYCNLPLNLILEWPNDGTTELDYAFMAYGTNMGNFEGECHTECMAYMPQYCDGARNAIMNTNAAV